MGNKASRIEAAVAEEKTLKRDGIFTTIWFPRVKVIGKLVYINDKNTPSGFVECRSPDEAHIKSCNLVKVLGGRVNDYFC
ncbi:MAG: hypothetical protein APF76_04730 [Desulfitibacter sp. BRH_c19]|nr:MAG: hypothetical protein APF76_04730 [Desulfitibacter sp. BRH_c19]